MTETDIGHITHYWPKASAAGLELEQGTLAVGDWVRIVGHGHDVTQRVESIQIDHRPVDKAETGMNVGIKVESPVHEKDRVYKVERSLWEKLTSW